MPRQLEIYGSKPPSKNGIRAIVKLIKAQKKKWLIKTFSQIIFMVREMSFDKIFKTDEP